jgi:hypothetical protein
MTVDFVQNVVDPAQTLRNLLKVTVHVKRLSICSITLLNLLKK